MADETVRRTIEMIDNGTSQYGYAQNYGYDNYGVADGNPKNLPVQSGGPQRHGSGNNMHGRQRPGGSPTGYSVNPAISAKTNGTSTFMITVSVAQTGGGSTNTFNPVFMFGGEAFSNSTNGYTAVKNASQITGLAFTNGKNVITFKYLNPADPTKFSVYTVSLATDGEYPFILNSLTGKNAMQVVGIQTEISDVTKTSQLKQGMQTFELDEFGKSTTNDLTTPKDLYQQQSDGIFLPHSFPISGKKGFLNNVLDIDGFSVTYYFYVNPMKGGCGC